MIALRLGIAAAEDILRRSRRSNVRHPVYRALAELGKAGEMALKRINDQEIGMLSLHPLQSSLVYINRLMIQQILEENAWKH